MGSQKDWSGGIGFRFNVQSVRCPEQPVSFLGNPRQPQGIALPMITALPDGGHSQGLADAQIRRPGHQAVMCDKAEVLFQLQSSLRLGYNLTVGQLFFLCPLLPSSLSYRCACQGFSPTKLQAALYPIVCFQGKQDKRV